MSIEERVKRLERQNKWMRRLGVVAVAVAAAVFLVGQGKKKVPPDLVVRSLTVKDKDGEERAKISTTSGRTNFHMTSKGNTTKFGAFVNSTGRAGLGLYGDAARRASVSS